MPISPVLLVSKGDSNSNVRMWTALHGTLGSSSSAPHCGVLLLLPLTTCCAPHLPCQVPTSCPGVPSQLLQPHLQWRSTADYNATLGHLAQLFSDNFSRLVTSSLSSSCDSKSRQLAGTGFMQAIAAGGPQCWAAAAAAADAADTATICSHVLAPGTP